MSVVITVKLVFDFGLLSYFQTEDHDIVFKATRPYLDKRKHKNLN